MVQLKQKWDTKTRWKISKVYENKRVFQSMPWWQSRENTKNIWSWNPSLYTVDLNIIHPTEKFLLIWIGRKRVKKALWFLLWCVCFVFFLSKVLFAVGFSVLNSRIIFDKHYFYQDISHQRTLDTSYCCSKIQVLCIAFRAYHLVTPSPSRVASPTDT